MHFKTFTATLRPILLAFAGAVSVSAQAMPLQAPQPPGPLDRAQVQQAQQARALKNQQLEQQLEKSTNQLVQAISEFDAASASQKGRAETQLVQLAQQRQENLIALLKSDASRVTTHLLPEEMTARMPTAAQPYIEKKVQVSGTLNVLVEDNFKEGIANYRFFLTPQGKPEQRTLQLHRPGSASDSQRWSSAANSQVTVEGFQIGSHLIVDR